MNKEKIRKHLLRDVERLRDKKYGFLKAGLSGYDRLFGRDSLIVSWQLLDFDPKIARDTLEILSKFQGEEINPKKDEEPGKILHEHQIGKRVHPKGYFPLPYYGSVDSTPLFLILFSFYYKKTGDKDFIKKHCGNILRALNWIFNFGDKDGDYFLEYKRKRKSGLFHQGWKDSFDNHLKITPPVALVEVQGYQYLALVETANLFKELFNDKKLEKSLLIRAEKLKRLFNRKFWMEKEKYFSLALDRSKEKNKEITSNPGHLLFTGIIESKKKEKLVVKKLFSKELLTPFGIRTLSTKSSLFDPLSYHLGSVWPHDNWIIAQGLKKIGCKKEYLEIKKALLRAFDKIGFLPEFYAVEGNNLTLKTSHTSNHPQAWAIGALLNFLTSDF